MGIRVTLGVAVAALAAGALVAVPVAHAVSGSSDADGLTAPISVKGSAISFSGASGPYGTVSCTQSVFNFALPGNGLPTIAISNPKFTGCVDTGDGVPVASFVGHGNWTMQFQDASDDTGETGPGDGDSINLTVPQGGLTQVETGSGCKVTFSYDGPTVISGSYDDAGHLTISGALLDYTTSQYPKTPTCPYTGDTGQVSFSATYTTSPVVSDN
jgi:hypothetical protein